MKITRLLRSDRFIFKAALILCIYTTFSNNLLYAITRDEAAVEILLRGSEKFEFDLVCSEGYSGSCLGDIFQPQVVSGMVSDYRGPLPGVAVSVKDKTAVAVTDAHGRFSIEAEIDDVLVFTLVGYRTLELSISSLSAIIVTLEEDATALKEVTVNAGYYTVKEKERTGSISKITSKEIDQQPVTNVLAAMQGRMAGVNITQANGTPGSAFKIEIRGQNSMRFGANNPLYIIDGVPYSAEPIGTGINSPILGGSANPLNSINPEQIESIEVLKDADATAIYGSRGANGVVLITTKRGKVGAMQFSAKVASGVGQIPGFLELMPTNQYVAMRQEAYANSGATPPASAYDINGTWDQTRHTDWQEKLMGSSAEITNVDATISGGSAQTQFLASGTFSKQGGVYLKETDYKKAGFRLGVSHASRNDQFKAAFTAGYTVQDNNQPRIDLMQDALRTAPNAPELFDEEGNLNWENNTFNNPMRVLEDEYNAKANDLIASGSLSYTILPGLELKSNLGFTSLTNNETSTIPSTRYNPAQNIGPEQSQLILSRADRKSWIIEPQASFSKDFGKLRSEALIGGTFQSQTGWQYVQYAIGFPTDALIHNLASAADVQNMLSEKTEYKYQAFFGRINFNYDQRFIVNLTGRRDGSSRFGPGKRYANFGAVGAAWLFSNESILKNSNWLSFGKLRASYGSTGNDQIGNYQFLDTYSSSGVQYDGVVGLTPSRLFNPNFAWEINRKLEVALETGFLRDRIFLSAGWYRNVSNNHLTGVPLPATTGFSTLQGNLNAKVENKGLELTLRTLNIQSKDFSWNTTINFTAARNKLVEFPDLESSTYASQYLIGQPMNIFKAYHLIGVDPQTGVYTFKDVNGDGEITAENDMQTAIDLNPKYYGGISNQIRYKRFSADFLFQFVKQKNFSPEAMFGMPGTGWNQPLSVGDHWQQPGDIASHQMYAIASNSAAFAAYNNYVQSDGVIVDASYIRLKSLSLSYELPAAFLKASSFRVFVEGQNLLTITGYKGSDPEFTNVGFLPPLRVVSAGLQLTL